MSHTDEAHAELLAKPETDGVPIEEPPSFESLGLGVPFMQAVRRAYPKVKNPTDIQARFIPAILGTQDILLMDETGSGKCVVLLSFFFVLFSAILNQVVWNDTWTFQ